MFVKHASPAKRPLEREKRPLERGKAVTFVTRKATQVSPEQRGLVRRLSIRSTARKKRTIKDAKTIVLLRAEVVPYARSGPILRYAALCPSTTAFVRADHDATASFGAQNPADESVTVRTSGSWLYSADTLSMRVRSVG